MNFAISEEYGMLKKVAQRFTSEQFLPLDKVLLEREMRMWTDGYTLLPEDEHARLMAWTKELGFWGIEVDEDLGGQGQVSAIT